MFRILMMLMVLTSIKLEALHQVVRLRDAMLAKMVKVKAMGLGGYQGYCIRMEVTNQMKDSILLKIEAGDKFNSINEQEQDILIVKQDVMLIKGHETKSVNVKGYCCQASNYAPALNSGFKLVAAGDSNLAKIGKYLSNGKFNKEVEQMAV